MKVEIWTQDNVLTHQKVVDTSVYEQDVGCQTAIYTGYWFLQWGKSNGLSTKFLHLGGSPH